MSKYGDENVCTCEMALVSARNNLHADACELWGEPSFVDGSDEWDGDLGCLVLSRNPWNEAEEWVWNGDTPVVRKSTVDERNALGEAVAEWETVTAEVVAKWDNESVEVISPEEQEALDALCQGESQDEHGMVCLEDGSYADFEVRVTYRKIMANGQPQWVEIFWDKKAEAAADSKEAATQTKNWGTAWTVCTCEPKKKFYCSIHNCQRDKESDPWRYWGGHTNTSGTTYTTTYGSWSRCDHCFDTFTLPGAQHENIKISAKRTHTSATTPDFGLYAYVGWNPDCVATFIPWQDYGLPKVAYAKAAQAIVHAWELSCAGKTVEIGCMGGHGRTGTILGCMAILSDPELSAKQAIAHVRKVHCNEAIETNEQEWFVEWFRCWFLGETCPPKPTTYISKHSANWTAASSAATATKNNEPTLPLVPSYTGPKMFHSDGASTDNKWSWCSHCKRTVKVYHNGGCPLDTVSEIPEAEGTILEFDPALYASGTTANARRRNAKRANRRAARKAKRHLTIPQEYV